MKNIQIIDGADNATFSLFEAEEDEFDAIFADGTDMELVEDFIERVGWEKAGPVLSSLWERPILKREANGIHGTLFYEHAERRAFLPKTKREVDWDAPFINEAQRRLFRSRR